MLCDTCDVHLENKNELLSDDNEVEFEYCPKCKRLTEFHYKDINYDICDE